MMDRLRFLSFNCNGALNKLPIIADLCDKADVIFLQETWTMPHNLGVFDNVHSDFFSFSTSAVDDGEILAGRPYGGLTILWRKCIEPVCQVVTFDDARLLGFKIQSNGRELLALNVYLPYFSLENVDLYHMYVGKVAAIIEESVCRDIMVLGDFNADVGSRFFLEWSQICEDYNVVFADTTVLPATSYTHVNNCSLTRSWLDHCLCTQTVRSSITSIDIDYCYRSSDHFALSIDVGFDSIPVTTYAQSGEDNIKWDFSNEEKVERFFDLVCDSLEMMQGIGSSCVVPYCEHGEHKTSLEVNWSGFTQSVRNYGRRVFGVASFQQPVVPGWNAHVRQFYDNSRRAFLNWRQAGCPRDGPSAEAMRFSRARFKHELRKCKRNEEQMRAESLAAKMILGKSVSFWAEIRRNTGDKCKLPQTIDGTSGEKNIAMLWKEKYSCILNSVEDSEDRRELSSVLERLPRGEIKVVTPEEICLLAGELDSTKAMGSDHIPCQVFKYAPVSMLRWLANFFNGVLSHMYVPTGLSDVLIRPIIKNKLNDPRDSSNYRPIAIATSASKLVEKLIMERLVTYLGTSSNQFGFKKYHSVDMCIYALKETINYYRSLGTPLFACFIDIKSAYDRVSHGKLFCKLAMRGAPAYIVILLSSWYMRQKLSVQWGGEYSDYFVMSNGIRQGSIISPYLFNIYVDDLNRRLSRSRIGCHIGGEPLNNFSYADDLAILAPSAGALNCLLQICTDFAEENLIKYSPTKTVVMLIPAPRCKVETKPNVYLGTVLLSYVDKFKYLGHIINDQLSDDEDIDRERRNLAIRGNILIRRFTLCTNEVKYRLFRAYCYQIYGCQLWTRYKQSTMSKLRVCYNTIMRMMLGVPPWHSARQMFVNANVRSLQEVVRFSTFSLFSRVSGSDNSILSCINCSDAPLLSNMRLHWRRILYPA